MKEESKLSVQAFDYVQLAFSKYHNHQVNACIKLSGKVNANILEKAVNLTVNDLPQLLCRFHHGEYYKYLNWIKVERIITNNLEKEIDSIMAESIDIEKGPQVRAALIREDKKDTIVVVMSHLLCDGMSMKRYIYLICDYYNSLIKGKKITNIYADKNRSIEWLKDCNLPSGGKERIKHKKEQIKFNGGNINLFAKCCIEKRYYNNIRSYINEHNVTLNDLLMAVYYKAVWEVFNYPLVSICCAMDLRRYIDNKEDVGLCNQTGNAFVSIKDAENMEFKELLQEVHTQMQDEKELGFCLKQVKTLEKAFRCLPHKVSNKLIKCCISNPQIAITNLGVVEKDKVTFSGLKTLECYLSPSLKKAPNFQMAVSTFEGNILLEVNMIVNNEDKDKINYYLGIYKDILLDVISR